MSVVETRTASQEDVAEIGRIIGSVWPESVISIDRITQILDNPIHSTMVFVTEDKVVGFVDGFLTTSEDGIKRWELDLLAVEPNFQRRGIGSALISANTHVGKSMGAEMARGLIAFDNIGSQRAFAKCGYETDRILCELLLANETSQLPDISEVGANETTVIDVKTINYTGLWVEGKRTKAALVNALRRLASAKYNLVGTVVACDNVKAINDAMSLGFEKVGRYHWWQRPL